MMQKNIILVIVAFALLMESIDTTVINTAIPAMARSFQANPVDLKLALISYLLSLAVFIPISGWIGDKFGVKKVFMVAIGIFTVSSIWCGFTNSLHALVVARLVQGLGGALTMPLGRLIIARTWERHELISKTSIVVMVGSVGMMLGPVLGGVITSHFSWRWIFWVNVPVGLIGIILSFFLLPEMPRNKTAVPLDKLGFVLFGSGLALLTLGLAIFSESDRNPSTGLMYIGFAIVLLFLYAKESRRKKHAIVRMTLFQSRVFRISVLGNLFARLGFGGIPFVLPLLLQIGLHFSAQVSGFLMAPTALGVLISKPFTLPLLKRFGYKKLLVANTLVVGFILLIFTRIGAHASFYFIGCLTFVHGFLISLQYTGMNSLAYEEIPNDHMSSATSILSTTQQMAQSFGVAFAAILLKGFSQGTLTLWTFHLVFVGMSIATLLSTLIFLPLKKEDGTGLLTN